MGLRKKTDSRKNSKTMSALHSESPAIENSIRIDRHDIELDAIERLKSNIAVLDDLQERLQFMNQELESLLGSRQKK